MTSVERLAGRPGVAADRHVEAQPAMRCRGTWPSSWMATGAGRESRPVRSGGPRRRRRSDPPHRRARRRPRHRGLSIYAFSRENWQRAENEVGHAVALLEAAIRRETPDLVRQGVRVQLLGRLRRAARRRRAHPSRRPGGHRRRHAHDRSTSPSTTPAARRSSTPCDSARGRRTCAGRDRRGRPSAAAFTQPTSPDWTCSSAPAASSASAIS